MRSWSTRTASTAPSINCWAHKAAIEAHLSRRRGELFSTDDKVLLYALSHQVKLDLDSELPEVIDQ